MKFNRILIIIISFLLMGSLFLASKTTFNFNASVEGFFILQGEGNSWYELTDDLVPEDANRLIWAMPLYPFKSFITTKKCDNSSQPCLDFAWDKTRGRGFIKNYWPDGTKLIVNLGRFRDSNAKYPNGIFIGGGLPPSDPDYQQLNQEATGMAFFNGKRWFHVWCNSNEGVMSLQPYFIPVYPTDWTFKGSWIRENDGRNLTIESRHELTINGELMDVTRHIFYTSGNTYVILSTDITSRGSKPVTFQYYYGDEPWIGYFGSSAGDIGWMGQELIKSEREIDTKKNTYFGMFDYGNDLAGEMHNFSGIANFIEWPKDDRPESAYISNFGGGLTEEGKSPPLNHPNNRFIGLKYGPQTLKPGETFSFTIAVGMAHNDPRTGFPVKPKTPLNP